MLSRFLSRKKYFFILFIFLITFFLVFALNHMTHYVSDDYTYRFVYKSAMPADPLEKINGFRSIIRSQVSHYNIWNGRFVAHSIVQFFMQYNKFIFNIFNSIAFLSLGLIIYLIINTTKNVRNSIKMFLLIFLSLWLFIPEFGKSVLWLSGSGNYLWMGIIYSSFLLFNLQNFQTNLFTICTSIVLGFLSGATNENSGPATTLIIVLLIIWKYIERKSYDIWRLLGVVSSGVGFIIMMKSPGSQKRGVLDLSFDLLKDHAISIYSMSISHFFFAYLIALLLIFILIYQKKITKSDVIFTGILFIGHIAGIFSLIMSPSAPLRTFFGPAIFMIIIIAYLFNSIYNYTKFRNYLLCVLALVTFVTYIYGFSDILKNYKEVNIQIETINKSASNSDVSLHLLTPSHTLISPYNGTAYLTTDKNSWFNSWMANYYGMHSITGIK
ncbi:hypothetical protein C9423_02470 [Lactobacillus sp. Koumiss]|nr:hypothetical protein C9423_02470 [Lactobacillus sp. Koumiss]